MTKKNVDVEFDNDVGYPYHLQPDIIKMALFIHNRVCINDICCYCIPLIFLLENSGWAHP